MIINLDFAQATLLQQEIEKQEYLCGIFLDLSKAFDTANHCILIEKLHHCGIRDVAKDWFIIANSLLLWQLVCLCAPFLVEFKAQFLDHYYFYYMQMTCNCVN